MTVIFPLSVTRKGAPRLINHPSYLWVGDHYLDMGVIHVVTAVGPGAPNPLGWSTSVILTFVTPRISRVSDRMKIDAFLCKLPLQGPWSGKFNYVRGNLSYEVTFANLSDALTAKLAWAGPTPLL